MSSVTLFDTNLVAIMRERVWPERVLTSELSPLPKGGLVGLVDFCHLPNREGEAIGNFADMIDLVERQRAALMACTRFG